MNSKANAWFKASGGSGILAPFIAFAFILLAIAHSPRFSWTENALSDLGVQQGVTAVLFNSGLIIGGLLNLVFALGLFMVLRGKILGKIGSFILILDALALAAIGVFPENVKPLHLYASVAFFILFPTSFFFIGTALLQMSQINLGLFTFSAAIGAVLVWVIPHGGGVAVPETLAALSASTWSIVLGFKLLKEASHSRNNTDSLTVCENLRVPVSSKYFENYKRF
ncbi:DUF998 domain-containing protein, partial [Candidatus Bathyarchaeota archaeon]|nr:DUF998 domain-containing protein [Candidatus Bathyarchaeota archaeon]